MCLINLKKILKNKIYLSISHATPKGNTKNHVFDYIELTEEYSIYEIPPLKSWIGKSIKELEIRNRYHINILGTKNGEEANLMPGADYVILAQEHLMVIGKKADIDKILKGI